MLLSRSEPLNEVIDWTKIVVDVQFYNIVSVEN